MKKLSLEESLMIEGGCRRFLRRMSRERDGDNNQDRIDALWLAWQFCLDKKLGVF